MPVGDAKVSPVAADRLEVAAPGDQHHVVTRLEEAATDYAAYRPGSDELQRTSSRTQVRLSPPNISETDVSSNTASIASAITLATDRTSSFAIRRCSASGKVLVTTTLESGDFSSRSRAGSESTAWVAIAQTSAAPRSTRSSAAAQIVPAVSIMSSSKTQWRPRTRPTTSIASTSFAESVRPALVDHGDVRIVEVVAVALGDLHPAGIRRDDHEIVAVVTADLLDHHLERDEVVEGQVEESLDLAGVQVDAHDPVCACHLQHVCDELRRYRLTTRRLAVLARVPVVRADRRYPLRRSSFCGVDHDQLLHDRVVHRVRVGLDDEDVGSAHRRGVTAVDLAVGEFPEVQHRSTRLRGAPAISMAS